MILAWIEEYYLKQKYGTAASQLLRCCAKLVDSKDDHSINSVFRGVYITTERQNLINNYFIAYEFIKAINYSENMIIRSNLLEYVSNGYAGVKNVIAKHGLNNIDFKLLCSIADLALSSDKNIITVDAPVKRFSKDVTNADIQHYQNLFIEQIRVLQERIKSHDALNEDSNNLFLPLYESQEEFNRKSELIYIQTRKKEKERFINKFTLTNLLETERNIMLLTDDGIRISTTIADCFEMITDEKLDIISIKNVNIALCPKIEKLIELHSIGFVDIRKNKEKLDLMDKVFIETLSTFPFLFIYNISNAMNRVDFNTRVLVDVLRTEKIIYIDGTISNEKLDAINNDSSISTHITAKNNSLDEGVFYGRL